MPEKPYGVPREMWKSISAVFPRIPEIRWADGGRSIKSPYDGFWWSQIRKADDPRVLRQEGHKLDERGRYMRLGPRLSSTYDLIVLAYEN